jgi:hypothetical protein
MLTKGSLVDLAKTIDMDKASFVRSVLVGKLISVEDRQFVSYLLKSCIYYTRMMPSRC